MKTFLKKNEVDNIYEIVINGGNCQFLKAIVFLSALQKYIQRKRNQSSFNEDTGRSLTIRGLFAYITKLIHTAINSMCGAENKILYISKLSSNTVDVFLICPTYSYYFPLEAEFIEKL